MVVISNFFRYCDIMADTSDTIKMPLAGKGLTLGARKGLSMFPGCVLTAGHPHGSHGRAWGAPPTARTRP